MSNTSKKSDSVFTPLGKGRIVYRFQDGTYVVEFEHGGGHIFRPEELFRPHVVTPRIVSKDANNETGID